MPSGGRGPLLLLPNTPRRANSRATGFPGRPHSAAPTFPGRWVRAPPPAATPTGNARGAHCLRRLRRLSHSPGVPLRGRSKPRTGLRPEPQPPLPPAAAARGERKEPGRHAAPLSQPRVRARQPLSLRPGLSVPPRKWVQGSPTHSRAPAGAEGHGRGLPQPRDPARQPRTHHSEAEVLRAGRGRAPGPAGRQREQQQRQRREPGPGGRRAGPGGSAAPHPARGAVGSAGPRAPAPRYARLPAALRLAPGAAAPSSAALRPCTPRPCAPLCCAPLPARPSPVHRLPAAGRGMLIYANHRRQRSPRPPP